MGKIKVFLRVGTLVLGSVASVYAGYNTFNMGCWLTYNLYNSIFTEED